MFASLPTLMMIALGGALGALGRHGMNVATVKLFGTGLPYGTFIVNVIGSFMMGIAIAKFAETQALNQNMKALYTTGFLGAFTTFSTFSLDVVTLWNRGETFYALTYMLGSVCLSICALAAGVWLMKGQTL